jgi:hypothetical protein
MKNRDNWLIIGMLFVLLGNDSETWVKYVNYTLGAIFIIGSFGSAPRDKDSQ